MTNWRGLPGLSGTASTPDKLKFLHTRSVLSPPAHLDLHLIGDNYATHKHPKVQRFGKRRRAFICTSHPPALPGSTW